MQERCLGTNSDPGFLNINSWPQEVKDHHNAIRVFSCVNCGDAHNVSGFIVSRSRNLFQLSLRSLTLYALSPKYFSFRR